MLDLADLLERVRATERRTAREVLARLLDEKFFTPSSDLPERENGAIDRVRALLALVDAAGNRVATLSVAYPPAPGEEPACRAGCAWCCHVQVAVSAPEAIRIAEHIRRALPPDLADQLTRRVAKLDAITRGLDPDARMATRLPCALLVDDRCAVYPVRPIMCRAWHSLDARACEANFREPDSVPVPFGERQRGLATHVALGLDDAIWDVGLGEAGVDLDLTAALHVALKSPDASARWLAGEALFAPAKAEG